MFYLLSFLTFCQPFGFSLFLCFMFFGFGFGCIWFWLYLVLLCLVLFYLVFIWAFIFCFKKRSSFVDTSWKSIFIYIPNHVKTPPTKKTTTTKSTCVCGPMAKTVRCQRIHRGSIPRNRTLNFWLLKTKHNKILYSSVGRAHDWSKIILLKIVRSGVRSTLKTYFLVPKNVGGR